MPKSFLKIYKTYLKEKIELENEVTINSKDIELKILKAQLKEMELFI